MDTLYQGITALLKSAVTQQNQPLPADFDLESAIPQIMRHQIVTMAFDGAVRCGIPMSQPGMQRLFQSHCKALQISERQMQALRLIFQAFEENGIDYLPLKGSEMKSLYPKPELRMMGDADILIRTEQYDRIVPVMESLGFAAKEETDHELVWVSGSLYLELHKHLVPSYNRDFHAYFGDGWNRAVKRYGTKYAMKEEDAFIYLFTHFAKHYRDGGIGCRQVVDIWVYRRVYPDLDEHYVRKELEKLHLLEFYQNVCRLIGVWFEGEKSDSKTDFMTEFIFDSGSWGKTENRVLSQTVRDSKQSVLGFSGKLLYLWKTAFPSLEALREKYRILKKHPYMLPVIWLLRPLYKLLFERKTLKKQKSNLAAFDHDGMQKHQKMLNDVGLDYHF